MDYKEKYEMALEGIQEILSSGEESIKMSRLKLRLQPFFPEIKELEDERIRRFLHHTFTAQYLCKDKLGKWHGEPVVNILAWLEKQGEKFLSQDGSVKGFAITEPEKYFGGVSDPIEATAATYTTEVETGDGGIKALVTGKVVMPKFKVGDFIVNDYCMGKVIALTDDAYLLDTGQGISFSCEHNVHLWTIADAKDGDVLQLGLVTAIFKNFIGNGNCTCYCSVCNGEFEIPRQDSSYGCHNATPATKEQRELLFKKMHEAGYVWDAEKKELKKIHVIDEGKAEMDYCFTKMMNGEKVEPKSSTPMSYGKELEARMYEACDRFNAPNTDPNRYSAADLFYAGVEAGHDLNTPAWSKEDEIIKEALIDFFNRGAERGELTNGVYDKDILVWLEKQGDKPTHVLDTEIPFGARDSELQEASYYIPEGFHAEIEGNRVVIKKGEQKPAAWSKEDEERIKNILSVLDFQVCWNGATGKKENPYQKEIDWLKSLKDRYTWKPSDEQMRALEYIIDNAHNTSYSCKIAKELLEQLRKLKGE